MTATSFRKSLFTTLDSALQGQPVTVEYKGRKLRIVAEQPGTKLSRAITRDTIIGDPDTFEERMAEHRAQQLKEWEAEWAEERRELTED